MRPCTCENFRPDQPFVVGRDCRLCWKYFHDVEFNGAPDPPDSESERSRILGKFKRVPCVLRGDATGKTYPCQSCNKLIDVPSYHCAVHTECVESKIIPGVKCCYLCKDDPRLLSEVSP